MQNETLKIFRINLLIQTRAAGNLGLTINELVLGAKTQGFSDVTAEDVATELAYLQDKKQIEQVPQEISPEVQSFRINATGRDFLAFSNL
jgi:archaellum component FlaG (FlaF/FlaG flagellin family)